MPRPPEGYRNRAGQQVPGVHDITNAYMPKPALVGWAYNRGKQGLPLYEKGALDIGTAVHAMAELHLKGDSDREIEAKLKELGPLDRAKAQAAYGAFCEWREHFRCKSLAHEVTIVSETYQLGGTPDCIAEISGEIGLLDFKTCTTVPRAPYYEQLLAMAAHATLWNERHPERKIHSCHIIYLPKDGSTPKHHAYANYETQWREFACLLAAFAAKNGTPKPVEVTRDPELVAELARLKAELQASAAAEAGKTLRAFAPPPPPRKHVGKGTQLTLDIEAGTRPPANVVPLRPPVDSIPEFLQRKRPAAPSVKPRVRLRADGSWFYVKG